MIVQNLIPPSPFLITQRVVELINNPKYTSQLAGALNLNKKLIEAGDDLALDAFDDAKDALVDIVKGTYPGVPDKLVKVFPYDNLAVVSK